MNTSRLTAVHPSLLGQGCLRHLCPRIGLGELVMPYMEKRSYSIPYELIFPRTYEAEELAAIAIGWFNRDDLVLDTSMQVNAIKKIHEYNAFALNVQYLYSWPTEEIIKNYLTELDNLFFFGSVRRWIKGLVRSPRTFPITTGPAHAAVGLTSDNLKFPYVDIKLCTFPWEQQQQRRAHAILWTLLHELLHAYFDVFTCRCRVCEQFKVLHQGKGLVGHGQCWVNVALEIVKFLDRHGLSFGSCSSEELHWMNIQSSVHLEHEEAKAKGLQPSTTMPSSFCFGKCLLWD